MKANSKRSTIGIDEICIYQATCSFPLSSLMLKQICLRAANLF